MPTVRTLLLVATAALAGCHSSGHSVAPTDPAALTQTLEDLAAFGAKRAGTAANDAAAEYVRARMEAAGLEDVHYEPFAFPRFAVSASSLAIAIDGTATATAIGFDVFEASGSGSVSGPVVWAGDATATALAGLNLNGALALVRRVNVPHRSTQYRNVIGAGAVGMIYVSVAPTNLRQVGSIRHSWESLETRPAVTIGADDGAALHAALDAGRAVTATVDVTAASAPANGHNVTGVFPGRDPSAGTIVIGAHYDTWFAGSVDNGGGVAALLALAERLGERGRPRATLVFVAFDGEEIGLYGGYAWLRSHIVVAGEPVRAVFNFEVPSSADATLRTLGHSPMPGVSEPLKNANLNDLYTADADMSLVPQLFGGIIPTDIQGFYRGHVPTVSTAVDSSYYHTTEDTPDKVDPVFLAKAVDAFDLAVREAEEHPASDFDAKDKALWNAAVTLQPRTAGMPLVATALITDSSGAPQAAAPFGMALLHDDFFLSSEIEGTTDSAGVATFTFPAVDADLGAGSRWLHVTSGPKWPLVEQIVPVE